MKKIILLILVVMTFSSLCYGQDDFETEVGPPQQGIILYLGAYKCNCTVNDDITYKTDILFSFSFWFADPDGAGFLMQFHQSVPPSPDVYYYSANYFPISPFIRIFNKDRSSVRGWGFKSLGIILLRIEDEGHSEIQSLDCVGIRFGI